jgi:hypothetical protein
MTRWITTTATHNYYSVVDISLLANLKPRLSYPHPSKLANIRRHTRKFSSPSFDKHNASTALQAYDDSGLTPITPWRAPFPVSRSFRGGVIICTSETYCASFLSKWFWMFA